MVLDETKADLALLPPSLTLDDVVVLLSQRYAAGDIYTSVGNDVLAVNPYRELPHLHSQETQALYRGESAASDAQPPHIYAVAEAAWTGLQRDENDHCIVIVGESGAGKTHSATKVLEYLGSMPSVSESMKKVQMQLLHTNPVMEAFGNATAHLNGNSSRFGKFIEINVDTTLVDSPQVIGGSVRQFLLEKGRVTSRPQNESNFHIFHQMLRGVSQPLRSQLCLEHDSEFFHYLESNSSVQDAAAFEVTMESLRRGGISGNGIFEVLKALSGILWLGQIHLEAAVHPDTGERSAEVTSERALETAASLLGISSETLQLALTRKVMYARGEMVRCCLTQEQAISARDSLAKTIYQRLFEWIVETLNRPMAMTSPAAKASRLCILDVFGFEETMTRQFSSLAHLHINYVNEQLNDLTMSHMICDELRDYMSEGIAFVPLPIATSTSAVELIERSPQPSIFSLLDEATLLGESPQTFSKSLVDHLANDPNFASGGGSTFKISHYAADVCYDLTHFMEQNRELFRHDHELMMSRSRSGILQAAFTASAISSVNRRPTSASAKFKKVARSLLQELSSQHLHYIRCIKPFKDSSKGGVLFDETFVKHQIGYLNVVDQIRLRQAGYVYRASFSSFLSRFGCIRPPVARESSSARAESIIASIVPADAHFQIGFSKVFIKDGRSIELLEQARSAILHMKATLLQAFYRGHLVRSQRRKAAAIIRKSRAVRVIASSWLAYRLRRLRRSTRTLQILFRAVYLRKNISARKIASAWRRWHERRLLEAVLTVQRRYRAMQRPRWYASLRKEAGEKLGASARLEESRLCFVGNYLPGETSRASFQNLLVTLKEKQSHTEVDSQDMFYDVAYKLNRWMRRYERRLLVTGKAVYVLCYHPRMETFTLRGQYDYDTIARICLSGLADNIVVMELVDGQSLCFEVPRKAEFCSFAQAMQSLANSDMNLPLVLGSSIGGDTEIGDEVSSERDMPHTVTSRRDSWSAALVKRFRRRSSFHLKFVPDEEVSPGSCVIKREMFGWRRAEIRVGAVPGRQRDRPSERSTRRSTISCS